MIQAEAAKELRQGSVGVSQSHQGNAATGQSKRWGDEEGGDRTVLDLLRRCIVGPLHNECKLQVASHITQRAETQKTLHSWLPATSLIFHSTPATVSSLSFIPQTLQGVSTQLFLLTGPSSAQSLAHSLTSFRAWLKCHLLRQASSKHPIENCNFFPLPCP